MLILSLLTAAPVSAATTVVLGGGVASLVGAQSSNAEQYLGSGSWQSVSGDSKIEFYLVPGIVPYDTELGTFTIGGIQSISYWTKNDGLQGGVDFYLNIYTIPYTGGDSSWYGNRLTLEPLYANNYSPMASAWNKWTTDAGSNQITLFDSNHGPAGFYGAPTLSDIQAGAIKWSDWVAGGDSTPIDYASQTVKYIVLATGNPWASGFAGNVDALTIELKGGGLVTLDLEHYPSEVWVDDDWVGTMPGVDPDGGGPATSFGFDAFATIQEGIDAVSGSTVNVAAGIYAEMVVIDKQLTLQGAGSASTIIDATGETHGILLTAGGVSVSQRLSIRGLTVKNANINGIRAYKKSGELNLYLDYVTLEDVILTLNGATGMEIHNDTIVSDMEIKDCEFVSNGHIGLRTASNVIVDGMTITDSKFNGNTYGIYLQGTINSVTILRSEFNNSVWYGGYMTEAGALTNLTIEDSQFINNVVGLMVWNEDDNADITISRTVFQDNDKWGVLIWGQTLTNVLIEACTVLNNDGVGAGYYGIDFNTYGEVMTNVAVHFTNITGHTIGGGVKNRNTAATAIVDATANWWGDTSGPYDPLDADGLNQWNPFGLGDAVTEYVLYDPWIGQAGMVTGGGWFDSPEGAYSANPELVGKATFGFIAKNKKDITPEGNTHFVFKTADLNFHSSSYDWLVVNQAGSNAQFKGWGSVNGEDGYRFMLWAGDNDPDTFRIKIWTETNSVETVIYDNGSHQPIEGGNIVVHKK